MPPSVFDVAVVVASVAEDQRARRPVWVSLLPSQIGGRRGFVRFAGDGKGTACQR